ncbi:MAG: flagellar biosynthetic protein FliR, partial [Bdellovibrionales bacterium]|nr:flagellar biosynthetic protein FliR [Bdellovibrionales bacterium]
FLARAFFYVLSVAGQVISVSMGLSSIQLFNPAVGDRSSAFDQFLVGLGTLFFLAINGHHIFLGGLRDSFHLVPLSGDLISTAYFGQMGAIVHEITMIGVRLAGPILIAVLFMNIAMAVIGRAVPQINVLITSLPVNIMVGFLVMFVSLPLIIWQMHDLVDLTAERVFQMMKNF